MADIVDESCTAARTIGPARQLNLRQRSRRRLTSAAEKQPIAGVLQLAEMVIGYLFVATPLASYANPRTIIQYRPRSSEPTRPARRCKDEMAALSNTERKHQIWSVVRVSSGNFLEMHDFFVFGYYASAIGKAFFPTGSDFAQLMLAFMTFGAGFLMRPLGGIFLGAYIDSYGRRNGLMLTLGLMAVGTISIALVPGYATLGALAPVIVVIGRLIQGFSAGAELGGVSVYLAEIATPGHTGFYVSWQSGSQQVAVIFVALLGVLLSTIVPPESMFQWGWRIPFLVGCLIIPLLFVMRGSLKETKQFEMRRDAANHPKHRRCNRRRLPLVLPRAERAAVVLVSFAVS